MSNQICVLINGKKQYKSFRWQDVDGQLVLQVYINKQWQEVIYTGKKTIYGDKIFTLVTPSL